MGTPAVYPDDGRTPGTTEFAGAVDPPGSIQSGKEGYHARPADADGLAPADRPSRRNARRRIDIGLFDRPQRRPHSMLNASPSNAGPGGASTRNQKVMIAYHQFTIGPDVHKETQGFLLVHRIRDQKTCRDIATDVTSDTRADENP